MGIQSVEKSVQVTCCWE